jgi:dolichol-phosphate mannosyltransferase
MNDLELSVIIPAYLEEENLRVILPRLSKVLHDLNAPYEVLVIDTMQSMDNTPLVCKENGAVYINRENGNYYGDAVRTGIRRSKGEYILTMDSDGSHPPEFIPKLYEYAKDFDVVIASRYIKGGYTENNKLLILMSLIVNWIYSLVLNIKCKDVSNSFRIYNADLLKGLDLYCNNFDIIEEILFKISRKYDGLKIKEVPFTFKQRMFGKTKRNLISYIFSYAFSLLRLRFGK